MFDFDKHLILSNSNSNEKAIGAGLNHHSELDDDVYAGSDIYVDSIVSARIELANLGHPIVGQVGEIILGQLPIPKSDAITVFQSMGII